MEANYITHDFDNEIIITINDNDASHDDLMDYDFDYDPNDMYYELAAGL
jgi:hypothetical protein